MTASISNGEKNYINGHKKNLQDSTDYLYFDNIRLDGKIGKAKFAYNSGQNDAIGCPTLSTDQKSGLPERCAEHCQRML